MTSPGNTQFTRALQERIDLLDQLENRPIKLRCKAEQDAIIRNLVGPEKEMFLDLRPFMQRNPFIVQSDASLSRAYRLFRTMGLRHMFVSQVHPKVSSFSHIVVFRIVRSLNWFSAYSLSFQHTEFSILWTPTAALSFDVWPLSRDGVLLLLWAISPHSQSKVWLGLRQNVYPECYFSQQLLLLNRMIWLVHKTC